MKLSDQTLLRDRAFINGEWRAAPSGATFPVSDPANGETLANVADMTAADARAAIGAAEEALPGWRRRTAKERANLLRRWFDLVMAHQDDLGALMTAENGKPLAEAKGEVAYGASFIEWFAEEGKRAYGETIPHTQAGRRFVTIRQGIGVTAAITPWNFPIAMITRKCAPALAAGCTVVAKPAEDTPLCALALAELAHRAGLPPGVFNVITASDPAAIGEELTRNPAVRKVSFTGSTAVGKRLMRQCADTVKKVSLELGGNAPFIVFDDADLDAAVEGAIASKYRNSGQTCVCANRILVQNSVYGAFAQKLAKASTKLEVGPGTEEGVAQGPLINRQALEKVERLMEDALSKGAKILQGGRRSERGGLFYQPTVLSEVSPKMALVREEIFGPVAPLMRFSTEDEAIRLANDTPYGLAAYFYASDLARVWRVSEALEYGMVGVNTGILSTEAAPFGGVKESGIGREGSRHGLDEFLEIKYLCLGGMSD
ncbi:MAG: NAD-dependent succinate-semialdehyde dehydrogenase [Alphaproteobacteria bacterium]